MFFFFKQKTAYEMRISDWSSDVCSSDLGLPCDKHHHEVAAAQHELGLNFGTMTQTADRMQVHKYVVHQVAHAYGKTATFMPKPNKDENGSGMHNHFSRSEECREGKECVSTCSDRCEADTSNKQPGMT